MTRIKKRKEHFSIDYNNEPLPALFYKQDSDCDFSSFAALEYISTQDIISLIDSSRQTLLIACNALKDESVIKALQKKADSGVRVYLLLGNLQENQCVIDALSGRCLIRTGIVQQGAMLLADHMTSQAAGILLMNAKVFCLFETNSYAIKLEPEQIESSFRSFCYLFWEKTDREYLIQNQATAAVAHPDGQIVTNHSHQLCGTLKEGLRDTLNSLNGASQLSQNFLEQTHIKQGKSSENNNEEDRYPLLLKTDAPDISRCAPHAMVLTDNPIPSLLISSDGNWLIPEPPDFNKVNWCLRLSSEQSEILLTDFEEAIKEAAWQYQCDTKLGTFSDQQSVRFADQPNLIRSIQSHRTLKLKDIKTDNIDQFLTGTASSLAKGQTDWQRDCLSHEIEYQVILHPPYCPSNATQDGLYEQWKQSEARWKSSLAALEYQQEKTDAKQAGIADLLKSFMKSFLLGQGQSVKQLNQEIERCKDWSITEATPAEREEMKISLQRLQKNVTRRARDTSIKMDEAKQHEVWQEKRVLLDKLRDKEATLVKSKKCVLGQHQNEKSVKRKKAENDFNDEWQKVVVALKDKSLSKIKDQTRETLSTMTIAQAQDWKASIEEKLWKNHYSNFERIFVNQDFALQKIERDLKEVDEALQKSQLQLKQAQDNLTAHGEKFIYQPNKNGKAFDEQLGLQNENGHQPASFSWPKEDLPNDATLLFSDKKQRFLVCFNDDDLEQAREDAKRLNAKIVCDEEQVNA